MEVEELEEVEEEPNTGGGRSTSHTQHLSRLTIITTFILFFTSILLRKKNKTIIKSILKSYYVRKYTRFQTMVKFSPRAPNRVMYILIYF